MILIIIIMHGVVRSLYIHSNTIALLRADAKSIAYSLLRPLQRVRASLRTRRGGARR